MKKTNKKKILFILASFFLISLAQKNVFASNSDTTSVCGNGILEIGERCDDGNKNPGDFCSPTCGI